MVSHANQLKTPVKVSWAFFSLLALLAQTCYAAYAGCSHLYVPSSTPSRRKYSSCQTWTTSGCPSCIPPWTRGPTPPLQRLRSRAWTLRAWPPAKCESAAVYSINWRSNNVEGGGQRSWVTGRNPPQQNQTVPHSYHWHGLLGKEPFAPTATPPWSL